MPPQQPQPQPQAQMQQTGPQPQSMAQQMAQPTGYHNPKPLITFEPHLLVDQKNEKAFAQGGDVVFANGQRFPLPGGFDLPTTGIWHQLLDIPQVRATADAIPMCSILVSHVSQLPRDD